MKVGITLPNLGPQATRDNILQTAIQAEKEGFDSVWTITRILWPLRSQTPYPGSPDGSLPTEYQTLCTNRFQDLPHAYPIHPISQVQHYIFLVIYHKSV